VPGNRAVVVTHVTGKLKNAAFINHALVITSPEMDLPSVIIFHGLSWPQSFFSGFGPRDNFDILKFRLSTRL